MHGRSAWSIYAEEFRRAPATLFFGGASVRTRLILLVDVFRQFYEREPRRFIVDDYRWRVRKRTAVSCII